MIEITKVRGTQEDHPKEIEVNVDTVYFRSNIIRIDEDDDPDNGIVGFHGWEYDEYTKPLWQYIQQLQQEKEAIAQSSMLAMESIAELYELMLMAGI